MSGSTAIRTALSVVKETFASWSEDKASRLGAALAYYSVFSIGPMLLIVIAVAGAVFGEEAVSGKIFAEMRGLIGDDGAAMLQTMVKGAYSDDGNLLASILSVALLLFTASGVVIQLKDALDTVWKVAPKPGRGLWPLIRDYFVSFAAVLGIAFILMVSLVMTAALAAIGTLVGSLLPLPEVALQMLNLVISFIAITMLFALMFKVLPDAEVRWRDVWVGAVATALLFAIGKFAIGLYLGKMSFSSTYGAAGSVIVLLAWIYYSAQILLLGAEFTRVYANRFGAAIRPGQDAVPMAEATRVQQGMKPSPGRFPAGSPA